MTRIQRILASLLVSGLCASGVSAAPVTGLANLPFYDTYDRMLQPSGGLSADGRSLVVGEYEPGYSRSVVLRQDLQNPTPLVDGQSGVGLIQTYGISGDGSVVVGMVEPESPYDWVEGAIWRAPDEVVRTGYLAGTEGLSFRLSWMSAASDTGEVVVGAATAAGSGDEVATIWTQATGLLPLPIDASSVNPNNESRESEALGVSADGQTVVGAYGGWAFVWNSVTGTTFLGDGFGSNRDASRATAVSADGSTVVGIAKFDGVEQPFMWTESMGLVGLYDVESPLGFDGWPLAVSGDGRVVVGDYKALGWPYPEERALVWTVESGIQDLREFLESFYINTEEWSYFKRAWAVSPDGSTIVGTGRRTSSAEEETFIVTYGARSTGVGLCSLGDPKCVPVDLLAVSNGILPGGRTPAGYFYRFGTLDKPQVNASGEVCFFAGTTRGGGIFGPDDAGRISLRVESGDAVPSAPGDDPRIWIPDYHRSVPIMNDAGDIAFLASMRKAPALPLRDGVWRSLRGTDGPELVALEGEPLPTDANATYISFHGGGPQIDDQGEVGFMGGSTSCSESYCAGVWVPGETSDPELVMSRGDLVPEAGSEARFVYPYVQTIRDSGRTAFNGFIDEVVPETSTFKDALWATGTSGDLVTVKYAGATAPGFPDGTAFAPIGYGPGEHHAYNDLGEVAFYALLEGPHISSDIHTIWKWHPDGQLELMVRSGDAAPTGLPGTTFDYMYEPVLNGSGDIAFLAQLSASGYGYWKRAADGSLTELLRYGAAAPHLATGVWLGAPFGGSQYPSESATWDPVLNDNGSTLLDFRLTGTGVDEANDRALYLVDAAGNPTLVLRKGDPIEFSVGDIRQISDYHIWDGFRSSTGRRPLSERDDVVALLYFTDGSEAIARFPVPEPSVVSGLAWACLSIAALARRRRS